MCIHILRYSLCKGSSGEGEGIGYEPTSPLLGTPKFQGERNVAGLLVNTHF